jgi:hypothetical protein
LFRATDFLDSENIAIYQNDDPNFGIGTPFGTASALCSVPGFTSPGTTREEGWPEWAGRPQAPK